MSLAEFQPACDGVVVAVVQAVCGESVLTHDRPADSAWHDVPGSPHRDHESASPLARTPPVKASRGSRFVRVSEAVLDVQELVDPDKRERPADLRVWGW